MTQDDAGNPLRRDRRPRPTGPRIVEEAVGSDHDLLGPDLVGPSARIPGDLRRPLTRFPTDPIGIVAPQVPVDDDGADVELSVDELDALDAQAGAAQDPAFWQPGPPPAPRPRRAAWALAAAIVALVISWFVGWGIPVALLAVGLAIAALRRTVEPRGVAIWALVLGLCATAFSLGWLVWAAMAWEQLG